MLNLVDLSLFSFEPGASISLNRGKNAVPEVKLEPEFKDDKWSYKLTNISGITAYQVYVFAKEEHYDKEELKLILQGGDMEAKESKIVHAHVQWPFIGCMSDKQYWVEFSDTGGRHFRYMQAFNNSGIARSGFRQIKKRTHPHGYPLRNIPPLRVAYYRYQSFKTSTVLKFLEIKHKIKLRLAPTDSRVQ